MPCDFFLHLFTSRTSTTGAIFLHYLSFGCNSIMSWFWGSPKSFEKIRHFFKTLYEWYLSSLQSFRVPKHAQNWFLHHCNASTMVLRGLEKLGKKSALPKIFFITISTCYSRLEWINTSKSLFYIDSKPLEHLKKSGFRPLGKWDFPKKYFN